MSGKIRPCYLLLAIAAVVAAIAVAAPEKSRGPSHPQGPPQPLQRPPAQPLKKVAVTAASAAPADEAFFEQCSQGKDWIKFRGSCYRHVQTTQYWEPAERDCIARGGHLVSIADRAENSFVGKLTYCQAAWIGRFAVIGNRLTDPASYRWTDGTVSQFHAHDFSATPLLHYPLISASNLSWYNNVYHGKQSYVCEVPSQQRNYTCNCPTGWKELKGYCYLMPQIEATYIEGDFYCRGRGSYMVSLHDDEELRAMSLLDVDSYGCPVDTWIGLLKLNPCRVDFSTGSPICYRWSDRSGDYKDFPTWQAGSPSTDQVTNCVVLKDRQIKTVPCHTRARFVCKKKV